MGWSGMFFIRIPPFDFVIHITLESLSSQSDLWSTPQLFCSAHLNKTIFHTFISHLSRFGSFRYISLNLCLTFLLSLTPPLLGPFPFRRKPVLLFLPSLGILLLRWVNRVALKQRLSGLQDECKIYMIHKDKRPEVH